MCHRTDESQNKQVSVAALDDGTAEWQGLPQKVLTIIKSRFPDKFQARFPMFVLRAILNDAVQEVVGFRPVSEIQRILSQAC